MDLDAQARIRERCGHPSCRFVEFRTADVDQSVAARFEAQVDHHGDRVAVRSATCEPTYRQLDRLANQIAGAILGRLGEGNEPVAVLFEHDTAVVAASLGVLKAGKCYLPLDPVSPAARTTYLLADSRARLIVTGARCHLLAGELGGGCLDLLDVERLPSEAGVERPALAL